MPVVQLSFEFELMLSHSLFELLGLGSASEPKRRYRSASPLLQLVVQVTVLPAATSSVYCCTAPKSPFWPPSATSSSRSIAGGGGGGGLFVTPTASQAAWTAAL